MSGLVPKKVLSDTEDDNFLNSAQDMGDESAENSIRKLIILEGVMHVRKLLNHRS